jgi:GR25 family glycosyltransferase involved in LPS biosynthesis
MRGSFIVAILVLIICAIIVYRKSSTFETGGLDSYVINLPRRADRLQQFKEHYSKSEIASNNLIVVQAIDGSKLDEIDGYITESTQQILKTGKRKDHSELTPGMIGCYLSHYKTYEEFLKSEKPTALIFEDDSKILPKFGNTFDNLPQDWDLVMIGAQSCMECPDVDGNFRRLHSFYGAGGYLINRQGALKMIQNKENPIGHQVDLLMGKLCKEGKLNVYSVKNNLVDTAPMGTDVQMGLS